MGRFLKLYGLIKNYGFAEGTRLFFRLGRKFRLQVPGIKHPVNLRPGTTDVAVFEQVFITQEYNFPPGCDPKVIIDGGANIGLGTVYFANRYPGATVWAIEPEEGNFAMLEKNASPYSSIKPVKAAFWNENEQLFIEDPGKGEWSFVTGKNTASAKNPVRALTIETLMKENNIRLIDILKIDIEGAEKELFTSNFEYWLPRTRVLLIELHDQLKQGTSRQFFKTISKYQFSFHAREDILLLRNEKPLIDA